MAARYNSRDCLWAGIIAGAFVAGLAVSWQRWGNPLIDCGREMNQPLRLMNGERLYLDVRHLYGPLSPYFHAALFRVFGPSLTVLYSDGIVSATLVLGLVYWLGRRVLTPFGAGTATLSVMWLCVFKPAGNYILPYSFGALHGTLVSLIALALLVRWLESASGRANPLFAVAGLAAGLSVLSKTEIGLAALAAGAAAAILGTRRDRRRAAAALAAFVAPALTLVGGVYGVLAWSVGIGTLVHDSWLLGFNLPEPMARYNAWVSGLDHPIRSLTRMLIAAAKMGALAAIIAAASHLISRRRDAAPVPAPSGAAHLLIASPVRALVAALVVLAVLAGTTGFDWDKGPYLAMPILLAALMWLEQRRLDDMDEETGRRARVLLVYAVYALACLGRMILHVRSGGAYGSFLLPLSVVLFTYAWAVPFGDWLERAGASRVGATIAVSLLLLDVIVTAGTLAHRYRVRYSTVITTSRGTMVAEQEVGQAWNEALAFIDARTSRGDFIAVLPEGTSLDFLSGRRNPLREEITTPGYLDGANEARAVRQLDASHAPLVLITNRSTREFGPAALGRDYATGLMQFIESRYALCGVFGPVKDPALRIGDRPFFVKAYCRR